MLTWKSRGNISGMLQLVTIANIDLMTIHALWFFFFEKNKQIRVKKSDSNWSSLLMIKKFI